MKNIWETLRLGMVQLGPSVAEPSGNICTKSDLMAGRKGIPSGSEFGRIDYTHICTRVNIP